MATESPFYYFPNPLAPAEEKQTKEYGLKYAKAIWARFNSELIVNTDRKRRWIINRKYAEGLNSIDKYKDRMDIGDTSWMNLDFSPIPIVATFVDKIVGKLINQQYKFQCDPIDPDSKTDKDEAYDKLYASYLLKDIHQDLMQKTGVPVIPAGQHIPDDEEDIELHMQTNYKNNEAMAMELAIQYVLDTNHFSDYTKEKILRDLINLKIAAVDVYIDNKGSICAEYIDMLDLVYPYSKHDDFRNIPYVGLIKKLSIQQIATMTDEFDEKQLFDIAKQYQGANYGNRAWNWGMSYEGYYPTNLGVNTRPYDDFFISVLEYQFLGTDTLKYESKDNKKGGIYFDKRKSSYEPSKDSKKNSEIITKKVTNRYRGCYIVGSEYLFNYKRDTNITREKVDGAYSGEANLTIKIIAPNIYDMQNKSLTERMIPGADQMTLIHLKKQQLIAKAPPPGVWINQDAVSNIVQGMGEGTMKPLEVLQLYQQTGSGIFKDKDAEGRPIMGQPIVPTDTGKFFESLNALVQMYNAELQSLYEITGLNPSIDGSSPNSEALVGVQKLAAQSTNNTLRPLNNSFLYLMKRMATEITLMVQDKFEYGDGLEGFQRAIGNMNVDIIRASKKIPLCDFGISVEYLPDEAEKAEVNQLVMQGLQNQQLETSDAIKVREALKSNVKLAERVLIYCEKKRKEDKMKEAQNASQMNAQQQVASAQGAAQAQSQTLQVEYQAKLQYESEIYKLKAQLSAQEHEQTLQQIALKNVGAVDVAQKTQDGKMIHAAFENAITPQEPQTPQAQ